jgi:DNA-binding NarL/FixJ family response regulator
MLSMENRWPGYPPRSTRDHGMAHPQMGWARPHPVHAREGTPGPQAGATGAPRILLVEDDYFVALDAEHALKAAGFVVVGTAATAEEAIAIADQEKPDLAVMDIRLAGGRDGVETALELFRRRGIRSIFATAHADPEMRRRAAAAEPLGWLPKPYTTDSLAELVRQVLKTRDSH